MENKLYIDESQILSAIEKVLRENRKVLKLGNGGGNAAPAPMPSMPPMDPSMGGDPNAMGGAPMDPSMGGDPNAMGEDPSAMPDGSNQFDTNFDAGVEADEETDPKRYIQQLTGKLSQSLNSFNNDNGDDPELSKYVAKMIVAAACKNLDEKAKKEIIEKINSAESEDEDMPEDDGEDMGGEEAMPDANGGEDMGSEEAMPEMPQQPMNERAFTKKSLINEMKIAELMDLTKSSGQTEEPKRPQEPIKNLGQKTPKAWQGKNFSK